MPDTDSAPWRLVIHRADPWWVATSPDLPGWVTRARSLRLLCRDVTFALDTKTPTVSNRLETAGG